MKYLVLLLLTVCIINSLTAQQPYNHNNMVFVATNKPNTIIYNDTIYKGSTQFKNLFIRTGDTDLAKLFQQHQSNKVAGNVLSLIGSLGVGFGVGIATANNNNKGTGWAIAGGGFITSIFGGYLMLVGQQKLVAATELFNKRYAPKATAGIVITNNGASLVVKF